MNKLELQQINNSLYEDAKIYWEENKGYTSTLLKRLLNSGCVCKSRGSIKFLEDASGKEIASGGSSILLLQDIAAKMR